MATISNLTLTILRDVANARITAEWDVIWSAFDQTTDLDYRETFALIGEDTVGDDPISLGLQPLVNLSSNQQASTHRTKNLISGSVRRDRPL